MLQNPRKTQVSLVSEVGHNHACAIKPTNSQLFIARASHTFRAFPELLYGLWPTRLMALRGRPGVAQSLVHNIHRSHRLGTLLELLV